MFQPKESSLVNTCKIAATAEQRTSRLNGLSKIAHVQHEGQRQVRRMIPFYNLDMILSVGYRVNSKNATQFRIWANKVLKEYLIKGYAVNSQSKAEQLEELKQTVHLLSNVLSAKDVTKSEAIGLLRVINLLHSYRWIQLFQTSTQEHIQLQEAD